MIKRLSRIFIVIFIFIVFFVSGCSLTDLFPKKKVASIRIDDNTLKSSYTVGNIDFSSIKIVVTYTDETTKLVKFSKSYIVSEDLYKLDSAGEKNIRFKYNDFVSTISLVLVDYEVNHEKGDSVYIFSLNDTHGSLLTDRSTQTIGLDKVTTVINSFSNDHILIADGDIFQGSYYSNTLRGLPAVEWMNYMNFDCFVLGNHEFDWGLEEIAVYKDGNPDNGEANFPFLGCNIYYSDTMTRVDWIDSYLIVENNGYKVGIIGAIGEDYTSSIIASVAKDYKFVDPVPLVESYAKELRCDFDCDLVIVAIHAYEEYTNKRFSSLDDDSRIDAIICGHTHYNEEDYIKRSDGYKVPVIESRSNNLSVGSIEIKMKDGKPSSANINHYIPDNYNSDDYAYKLINSFLKQVEEAGERVIGYTSSYLSKSSLGSWICDAACEEYDCDYAIMNTGGVRSTIDKGNITYSDVYKVFPFDNTFVICEMTGSQIKYYDGGYCYFNSSYSSSSVSNNTIYKVAMVNYEFENYAGASHSVSYYYETEPIRDIFARWITFNFPPK